jgi:hypothetical protein
VSALIQARIATVALIAVVVSVVVIRIWGHNPTLVTALCVSVAPMALVVDRLHKKAKRLLTIRR